MIVQLHNLLSDKTRGSLMGAFIGDAFALPVECRSPDFIQKTFGYLDKYQSNQNHPYKGVAKYGKGTISDDSQLTLCLMDSIQRSEGYNIPDIKKSHIESFDGKWGTPIGWGKTTREAISKMREGLSDTAILEGAGNGPVIKISPLAIYCAYKTSKTTFGKFTNNFNYSLLKKCAEITNLTHGDKSCSVAAYCHSRLIIRAMQNEIPVNSHNIATLIVEDAIFAENKLQIESKFSDRLKSILLWKQQLGEQNISVFDMSTSWVSKMICTEKSSWIYNSYPLTAYCIAKYIPYHNFKYAITETANAGADADSNTSMVGTVVGALLGFSAIPIDMIKGIQNWNVLLQKIKEFEISLG